MYLCDQRQRVSNAGCIGDWSIRCFCYWWRRAGNRRDYRSPEHMGQNQTVCGVPFIEGWKRHQTIILSERRRIRLLLFVTNKSELISEEVVSFYEKRGNCENYIKEAKYDLVVGHLLLQSFWANEAIFQLMMLAYNLFLMFKMDFAKGTEYYWQQIKTFRLKYIFLSGKIIRTARNVVMKLSEKYPYREIYEQSLPWKTP